MDFLMTGQRSSSAVSGTCSHRSVRISQYNNTFDCLTWSFCAGLSGSAISFKVLHLNFDLFSPPILFWPVLDISSLPLSVKAMLINVIFLNRIKMMGNSGTWHQTRPSDRWMVSLSHYIHCLLYPLLLGERGYLGGCVKVKMTQGCSKE